MGKASPVKDNLERAFYDPGWPDQASTEIARLTKAFVGLSVVDIQHIGSTAVPGVAAKPIIDLMIGLESLGYGQALIPILQGLDYVFWKDNPKKDRLFFVKGMPPYGEKRTHHVHVFATDHEEWQARQLFRDYLCAHPEERAFYSSLKRQVAAQYGEDREAYTASKTEFVHQITQKSLMSRKNTNPGQTNLNPKFI